MKSDDKTAVPKGDDKLPELRDSPRPTPDQQRVAEHRAMDERDGFTTAEGDADAARREEAAKPISADERRKQEREAEFEERKKQREEENKRNEEHRRMAEKPNAAALKLFLVSPVDDQTPPFHFSSTPGGEQGNPLVLAENEDYARRMVAQLADDPVWEDAEKTVVTEFKPRAPKVVTMAFKG